MDRPISTTQQNRNRRKKWLRYALIGVAVIALFWAFRYFLKPRAESNELRFATVEQGDIQNTITATGLVVPAFEEQLNAPVSTTIEHVHLANGTEVKPGDLVLTLDREYVQLELDGRRDQLALRKNNVDLLKLEYDRDIQELDYNTRIKSLELSTAEAQLADARRLLEVGGATQEEVERADLSVQIIRLERDKLENELNYRRSSLDGRRRNLELEVGMEEKEVKQLSRKLRETEVRAPRAGVVTWINENIGQQVVEGAPLVRIADLGKYRLEGTVSDRYAPQIDVGLPVEVRIGRERLVGTIASILPEVTNNTLQFIVALDDPSHQGLRPNLRTEFNIVIGEKPNVLRVKNGPAFRGGLRQEIFVIRDQEAIRTEVTLGLRSSDFIEITSGLEAGDRIIISDTRDYENINRFSLQ
ncbi:MAG: HlyD family efflux transporter periplasmic adaptor subunit [Bacteroidota bacterium]